MREGENVNLCISEPILINFPIHILTEIPIKTNVAL